MIRKTSRNGWLERMAGAAIGLAAMACVSSSQAAPPKPEPDSAPVKIGIIGTGHIGGTLASLWVKSGHEVLLSSRHPDELKSLAQSLGPQARVGTPHDAAVFGDVVLLSVPYGATPQVGHDLAHELAGKIVLDTGNPYPARDGTVPVGPRRE